MKRYLLHRIWVAAAALGGVALLLSSGGLTAQAPPTAPPTAKPATKQVVPGEEYSGMYTFLAEGEFVQVSVGELGKVTGFVSRYGDSDSDRGEFLDHFFKDGKLEGDTLTFTTQVVHAVSYEFKGKVERGPAKASSDEGYYVLRGVLRQFANDAAGKSAGKERDVVFKRFPDDVTNGGAAAR